MNPSTGEDKTQITVYGADWCHDTRDARTRLGELGISYQYVNIDHDSAGKDLVQRLQDGGTKIPCILFGNSEESRLIEPTQRELDSALRERGLLGG